MNASALLPEQGNSRSDPALLCSVVARRLECGCYRRARQNLTSTEHTYDPTLSSRVEQQWVDGSVARNTSNEKYLHADQQSLLWLEQLPGGHWLRINFLTLVLAIIGWLCHVRGVYQMVYKVHTKAERKTLRRLARKKEVSEAKLS